MALSRRTSLQMPDERPGSVPRRESSSADAAQDAALDLTRDGTIDGDDLAMLAAAFGGSVAP
jgi:hypothetical protein